MRICYAVLCLLAFAAAPGLPSDGEPSVARDSAQFDITSHAYEQPVDPDRYLVRPGERLQVTFLKTKLPSLGLSVNAEGVIIEQSLGSINVVDMTLTETREVLREVLGQVFNAEDIAISIGRPYPVTIRVAGAVKRPGRYRGYLSQRVSDLIDSAGGITSNGSSRSIRFTSNRGEQTVDLDRARYEGNPDADPCLYSGLTVFVPTRSSSAVQVQGGVNDPREIELLGGENLEELVALAGGFAAGADVAGTYIMNDPERAASVPGNIQAGDILIVPMAAEENPAAVTIFGAVHSGGRYPYNESMNLSRLLKAAGGVRENANLQRVTVFRTAERDAWGRRVDGRYPLNVSLRTELNPETVMLRPNDSVFVPVRVGHVIVSGDVRFPGLYPYHEGATVATYITNAGGPAGMNVPYKSFLCDRVTDVTTEVSSGVTVRDGDEIVIELTGEHR